MKKIYYADGACSGNPGPGGFGVISLNKNIIEDYYMEHTNKTTNNRMELSAILYVLQKAYKDLDNEYIIYSDSAYAVNICNDWIYKWAINGWKRSKNQKIENLNLIKELYKHLKREFPNFQINKCKGHDGVLGNELADALASSNMNKFDKLVKENNLEIVKN